MKAFDDLGVRFASMRSNHAWPFSRAEGYIFLTGLALALSYLAALSISFMLSPARGQALVAITATNVLFGRAAGMSMAYAIGFGNTLVIALNMFIESVLVLLFYPVFVLSIRQLLKNGMLREFMERTRSAAEKHRDVIRKYGIIGLMGFVWLPVSMTGPLIGCALGYLMGLRPWVNITAVLIGTYAAIISWAFLLREAFERLAIYGTYVPIAVVAAAFAGFLIVFLIKNLGKPSSTSGGGKAT